MLYTDIENMVKAKLETDGLDYTISEVKLTSDQIIVQLKDPAGNQYQLPITVDTDNNATINGDFTPINQVEAESDEEEARKLTPECKADEEEAKTESKSDETMSKMTDMLCKAEESMSRMLESCTKFDTYCEAKAQMTEAKAQTDMIIKDLEAKAQKAHWLDSIAND